MLKTIFFISAFLLAQGCGEKSIFKKLPEGPVNHQLIVLAKTNEGLKLKGFAKASPPKADIFLESGRLNAKTVAEGDGSFMLDLPGATDGSLADLSIAANGKVYRANYSPKILSQTLNKIAKKPFSTGKDIGYFLPGNNQAYILSTDANLVSTHQLSSNWILDEHSSHSVLINRHSRPSLYPRMMDRVGTSLIIPLFGAHELLSFNLNNESDLFSTKLKNPDQSVFTFNNNPPLKISAPISADDISPASQEIKTSIARNPERILAIDDEHFLASFTNYYQFNDPSKNKKSVVGPGIIALLKLQGSKLLTLKIKQLSCLNPQFFTRQSSKDYWLTCTGSFDEISANRVSSQGAAIAKLSLTDNLKDFTLGAEIKLDGFTPAEPAINEKILLIPEAWGQRVLSMPLSESSIKDNYFKTIAYHRDLYFTTSAHWHQDSFFLGTSDGHLVSFSDKDGFFNFPFVEPISIAPNQNTNMSWLPLQILVRPGLSLESYEPGYDLLVRTAEHNIVPLNFLEVFGN